MTPPDSPSLLAHLSILPDPRIERTRRHLLVDIVAIAVCAVVGGADNWTEVELFGRCKEAWFKRFLELPNGIPSHDTFGRVFSLLDPQAFETVFRGWVQAVQGLVQGVIAIDGKCLKGSGTGPRRLGALHLVSAWAVANRVVLGQVQTEAKSNEITAIPELLAALDLKGCLVTLDAMGCQKTIAEQIIAQQGDYVLTLKANHGNLYHEVKTYFEVLQNRPSLDLPHSYTETLDKDHGRLEIRRHWSVPIPAYLRRTGRWMSRFRKITAGSARTMPPLIWLGYAGWRRPCSSRRPPPKPVSRANAIAPAGIMTIFSSCW